MNKYNVKGKKSSRLASYTSWMEGLLHIMCFIEKTFFFTKVGEKQLGLKSLASFTNIGPNTYLYCCENTVIPL